MLEYSFHIKPKKRFQRRKLVLHSGMINPTLKIQHRKKQKTTTKAKVSPSIMVKKKHLFDLNDTVENVLLSHTFCYLCKKDVKCTLNL